MLTLDALNCRIPRGSSFSLMVTSATSMPGLFTLGCPAPADPCISSTPVIFTRKVSASSGMSSLIITSNFPKLHTNLANIYLSNSSPPLEDSKVILYCMLILSKYSVFEFKTSALLLTGKIVTVTRATVAPSTMTTVSSRGVKSSPAVAWLDGGW